MVKVEAAQALLVSRPRRATRRRPNGLKLPRLLMKNAAMAGREKGKLWRCALVAAALCVAGPSHGSAQSLLAPQDVAPAELAPGTGRPGASIVFPSPLAQPPVPPLAQSGPVVPAGRVALMVAAR
jgi:hypothetical protein